MKRDFLGLKDRSADEYRALFDRTTELKAARKQRRVVSTLAGRTLALIFEKASTRTRLSFEAAMFQMGGSAISLPFSESQLARGEPLPDTARVVSGYSDVIVMRTFGQQRLLEFAQAATVPVINGLSDDSHPVQVLADLFTVMEKRGELRKQTIAFVGDGSSNMARSWVEAAPLFGFQLRLASPTAYRPPPAEIDAAKGAVALFEKPQEAVKGADVVATDVWTSMGQEQETAARRAAFAGFCVDLALLKKAKKDVAVLHCLPAHRGEEITEEVIDSPQSLIFEEAENRMHVQKALLEQMLTT